MFDSSLDWFFIYSKSLFKSVVTRDICCTVAHKFKYSRSPIWMSFFVYIHASIGIKKENFNLTTDTNRFKKTRPPFYFAKCFGLSILKVISQDVRDYDCLQRRKFAIVDMVVHDFNEERLETALIPDFWLYAFGYKLYCAYPTLIKSPRYSPDYVNSSEDDSNEELTSKIQLLSALPKSPPTVGGELVKYSADQSQTYSTKQPHTIGNQAFPDLSFLTTTPNIDVASQNLIIGEAATTLTDSRFVRCNLGIIKLFYTSIVKSVINIGSKRISSSNPQFGVSVVYPTQSGANAVYPTQSGASAVYPTQSGVSGVYPTQSGSRAAYPTAKKSAHCAVSQTQPGSSIVLSPQPGVRGVYPKKSRVDRINTQPGVLSSKTVDVNHNLTSLESVPLPNKVDDGVLKMFFKCMEEFKGIKQHLRVFEEKIEGNQLQEVKQVELDEIPLTSVEDYFFQCEVLTNAGKCNALVKFVKSIGGANGRDAIKRAWSALTKIDCRAHCNVLGIKKGANQKYNLKGTAIVKAVLVSQKLE
ncbi:Uncharacterized protein APZ42_028045 [Daphnia magna]|uniref:DUF4806 domain-containing protein n=1 Tax=Daphnia magna TaxID=35525 RepID=A0A164QVS2_9CRUS|nr:Uncharacterized protein APZ42_028045 [Daphnia magna]